MRPTLRTAILAAWGMIILAIIAGIILVVNPKASRADAQQLPTHGGQGPNYLAPRQITPDFIRGAP